MANYFEPTTPNQRHPLYATWQGMHSRCNDKANYRYGGRGITVADEWKGADGFKRFVEYMGPKQNPKHSIDRINPDGNYEPGNVRWADHVMQANNKSKIKTTEKDKVDAEWHKQQMYNVTMVRARTIYVEPLHAWRTWFIVKGEMLYKELFDDQAMAEAEAKRVTQLYRDGLPITRSSN